MKAKFLFAGLAAAIAFGALAPSSAKADHGSGYYTTRVVGYDRCGKPIYRQVWVPRSSHSHSSGGHSHGGGGHSHGGSSGGYIHAPGVDIHFGRSSSRHHHGH